MAKKIIVTTGGTGGHIYPALSVGQKLIEMGIDVLFVGSNTRMEHEIVPEHGVRFKGIDIYPFNRLNKIISNIKSLFQAIKIVKNEKPDIIIGFGNYISAPMLFAGMIFGKKIYLQEQNVDLGIVNRMFYRVAKKSFLAFDVTYEEIAIKNQYKFQVTGNPLREDIYRLNKDEERKKLKISKDEKILLITGGSLGAKSLNEAMINNLKNIYKEKNIRIYWATGEKHYNAINEKIDSQQLKVTDIIKPYFNNMVNIMAAADLIICRAGALTVSEIIQLEKPSILIPYNSIKVGQYKNAKILVENGISLLYDDSDADEAVEKALILIKDDKELEKMSRKAKSLKKDNSVEAIVESLDIWRN